jgi:predicted naringenin-chalcone synthase
MQRIYSFTKEDQRKLRFIYHQSRILTRYSVISDYSKPVQDWKFYPRVEGIEPFPSLEQRMVLYEKYAAPLSVDAIRKCLGNKSSAKEITHLITVSCTGMSAPGLDLQIMDILGLPKNIFRTSINFMGCYAAIHAIKFADLICRSDSSAKVMVVCTELCTIHFQKESTPDNISSSLLFADGSAAALITGENHPAKGIQLTDFYSEVLSKGKKDMAWELSSTGFLMTLSNYIPDLIEEDFQGLTENLLERNRLKIGDITHWCMHPGGKKILEAIHQSLHFTNGQLDDCYSVLNEFGNMSSPTILFVLEKIMHKLDYGRKNIIYGAAFGPGLTMETFLAHAGQ